MAGASAYMYVPFEGDFLNAGNNTDVNDTILQTMDSSIRNTPALLSRSVSKFAIGVKLTRPRQNQQAS